MLEVLVIAPHPDDAEVGMAGTIVQLVRAGRAVGILDLTDGEPTPHGSLTIRAAETDKATEVLGVSWRQNLGLTNRALQSDLESRAKLAEVIRETRPRWLFAPYWTDAHPDHVAATRLIEDARFWAKLTKSDLRGEPHHPARVFHYFSIHLRLAINPDFIVDISESWAQKEAALRCYQSQFVTGRETESPSLVERFETSAAYFGQLIGKRYGEPFASREPVGLTGLSELC
ncbi:MAG: bacillithiol biosynthesis deacetylase BshB1 [Planctomycetota bacterium]